MPKLFQDIWILTETGIPLFSRIFEEIVDENLFGSLMSALNTFAAQVSPGGLSNFAMGRKRYSIYKRNDLIFIASSSPKVKEKKVIREIALISDKFFNMYGMDIFNKFEGEISQFYGFEKEIKPSVEENVPNFLKSL